MWVNSKLEKAIKPRVRYLLAIFLWQTRDILNRTEDDSKKSKVVF